MACPEPRAAGPAGRCRPGAVPGRRLGVPAPAGAAGAGAWRRRRPVLARGRAGLASLAHGRAPRVVGGLSSVGPPVRSSGRRRSGSASRSSASSSPQLVDGRLGARRAAARRAGRSRPRAGCGRTGRCRTSGRAGWPSRMVRNRSTHSGVSVVVGGRGQPGEDLDQLVVGVVGELDGGPEPAGQAGVLGDEQHHRVGVAGDDQHQVVAAVLHLLDQGVDRLLCRTGRRPGCTPRR